MTTKTQATEIKIGTGDGETVAFGADTFVAIGEVIGFDDSMERDMIETTSFQSSIKEFVSGLMDAGQCTVRVNLGNDDVGQVELLESLTAGQRRNIQFTLPSGTLNVANFKGFVQSLSTSGTPGDKWEATFTIKRTSVPAWA